MSATTTLELSRLAHQVCADLTPFEAKRLSATACVRAFLYTQSGAADRTVDSTLETLAGDNRTLARVLTEESPMRQSYHARDAVEGRKFLSFPAQTWVALAQAAAPSKNHDIAHFREIRQRMTELHECSHFVNLTNAAAPLKLNAGTLITLYATGNAGVRRREEVCRALATPAASSKQLFDLQTKYVADVWKTEPAEANRQLKTVLASMTLADAEKISHDAADIDHMLAAAAPQPKVAVAAPAATTASAYVAEISLRNDGRMDDAADAIVKAFCHKANVPVDQHRDSQRRVYLTAGLRNASALVEQDSTTFPPHVRDYVHAISAITSTHADVHRPEYFPAVVEKILEEQRTLQPLRTEKRTLMMEVNQFMQAVFGPAACEDASLLKTNSVRLWLLANSAGPSWSATSMNLTDAQETAYQRYLSATKGPSIEAMMALKKLYMPFD